VLRFGSEVFAEGGLEGGVGTTVGVVCGSF